MTTIKISPSHPNEVQKIPPTVPPYLSIRNKEVSERKHKDGFTCSHCHSNNAVRFGKYNVKMGSRTLERQRYRCKDCGKTFTDVTNNPSSSYSPSSQMDGARSMYDRRQFPT